MGSGRDVERGSRGRRAAVRGGWVASSLLVAACATGATYTGVARYEPAEARSCAAREMERRGFERIVEEEGSDAVTGYRSSGEDVMLGGRRHVRVTFRALDLTEGGLARVVLEVDQVDASGGSLGIGERSANEIVQALSRSCLLGRPEKSSRAGA